MTDRATPNLPSRNFEVTSAFFKKLGFAENWKDSGWMIMRRGELMIEFFPHPKLDPTQSWHSCCLRLDELDAFYAECKAADITEKTTGAPRLHPPRTEDWGGRVAALIDPDGSLLRLIGNN